MPDHIPERRIAIIGAGFTGSLLAVHLMRLSTLPTRLLLIEKRGDFGPGQAYSTGNPDHLLNVRAANMSAFPDDPQHFLRWLWARDNPRHSATPVPPSGLGFVSRAVYGTYVQELLTAARRAAPPHVTCKTVSDEVVGLSRHADHDVLRLSGGETLEVDLTLLCIGTFPPSPPPNADPALHDSARYVGDSTDEAAVVGIPPEAPVLILGSGLAMVDVVLSLEKLRHRGPITALSPRGLMPQIHRDVRVYHNFLGHNSLGHNFLGTAAAAAAAAPAGIGGLLRRVRQEVRQAAARNYDWRDVLDALRPQVQHLWRSLAPAEQRRFLRHLRPFWDSHRHRLAPAVAQRLDALRAAGRFNVLAGHLCALTPGGPWAQALIEPQGGGQPFSLDVGAVINAAGPECDYGRIRHPLVRDLLSQGLARPDALRLGLDVTAEGALVGIDGAGSTRLFALGPATTGTFWEINAVPEIRSQCAEVARALVAPPLRPLPEPAAPR